MTIIRYSMKVSAPELWTLKIMEGLGISSQEMAETQSGTDVLVTGHKAETAKAGTCTYAVNHQRSRGMGKEVCDETARADSKGQTR